jgi:nicotinic acid phosphoribosyltransferase
MEDISPLLTDLYQINMIQAYLDHGDTETAVNCSCAACRPDAAS